MSMRRRCASTSQLLSYTHSSISIGAALSFSIATSLVIPYDCAAAMPDRPAAPLKEALIEFTVSKADTLTGLSSEVLVSPRAWREVAALNRLANPDLIVPGQVLKIPVRLMRGAAVNATLVSVVGDVQRGDIAAAQGDSITEGESIKTGPGGSAVIALADGSRMQLPPSSLAQLAASRSYGQRSSSVLRDPGADISSGWFAGTMRVLRGSVKVFATKVLRAKPLEVVTPTAVVGVRGTVYRVGIDETAADRTHSEVLEGLVHMGSAVGAASVELPAGFGGVIGAETRLPLFAALLPAPDLSTLPERFERPIVRFKLAGETTALRVQVASDEAFEKLVIDQTSAIDADVRISGLADAQWYLRARRIDPQGIEGIDSSRPFVLKATPQPPAYRSPRADAKQAVGSVEFAWAPSLEAPRSRLQVASDAAFANVVVDRDGIDGAVTHEDIATAGSYYWRLASIRPDGDHGPFGDAQHFELRPTPEPPQSERSADGKALVFRWSGRAEDRQQVQLARDPEFTQVIAQDELTTTEWSQAMPTSGGKYYFRYRSLEPDGFIGPYSATLMIDVPRDWTPLLFLVPPALFLIF